MFESFWNVLGYTTPEERTERIDWDFDESATVFTLESREIQGRRTNSSVDDTYADDDEEDEESRYNGAWFDLYGLPRAPSCTDDNDESRYGEEQSLSCYDEDEWTLPAPPSQVY
jgi:hypothetical protein